MVHIHNYFCTKNTFLPKHRQESLSGIVVGNKNEIGLAPCGLSQKQEIDAEFSQPKLTQESKQWMIPGMKLTHTNIKS
jgi:hypothetical protein